MLDVWSVVIRLECRPLFCCPFERESISETAHASTWAAAQTTESRRLADQTIVGDGPYARIPNNSTVKYLRSSVHRGVSKYLPNCAQILRKLIYFETYDVIVLNISLDI